MRLTAWHIKHVTLRPASFIQVLWDLRGFTTACLPNHKGRGMVLDQIQQLLPGVVYRKSGALILKRKVRSRVEDRSCAQTLVSVSVKGYSKCG